MSRRYWPHNRLAGSGIPRNQIEPRDRQKHENCRYLSSRIGKEWWWKYWVAKITIIFRVCTLTFWEVECINLHETISFSIYFFTLSMQRNIHISKWILDVSFSDKWDLKALDDPPELRTLAETPVRRRRFRVETVLNRDSNFYKSLRRNRNVPIYDQGRQYSKIYVQ